MKSTWNISRDRVGAVLLIVLGAGVSAGGLSFRMGTLTDMGSGFIPVVLGALLIFVGIILFVTDGKHEESEAASAGVDVGDEHQGEFRPQWRGWICILLGIAAFVTLGTYGGLIPATFASVFIAALGDRQNRLRDCFVLSIAVTVFGVVVFGYGLGLQMPLLAWG